MPSLSQSRLLRYITFGALYFAQGVPWGFVSVGYLVLLTDLGLSNEGVSAALGAAYLPWTFKVFWGPLIDRFPSARFGRRRPFIIGAELLMGATLLALFFLDPKRDMEAMSTLVVLHNAFAALQDVSVDALAVDILLADERGKANSVMWACKTGGTALGGAGGAVLAKHAGWPVVFLTMAAIVWAIMIFVMLVRERPRRAASPAEAAEVAEAVDTASSEPASSELGAGDVKTLDQLKELVRSFAFPTALVGVLIAILTPAGYALTGGVTTRLYRADLKLSAEAIGFLQGALASGVGVVGALLGGALADRLGVRKVTGAAMAGIAAALGLFAAVPHLWPSTTFVVGFTNVRHLLITAYNAATLGFFMTMSNPRVGATQFAIFMAGTNLTYSFAAPIGGWIADRYGVAATFAVAGVVQLVTIGLLPLCDPRVAEARFRPKGRTNDRVTPLPEVARAPGA